MMKKWMVIMGLALFAAMVGTAVVAWSGEEDEADPVSEDTSGYEAMIAKVESACEATACVEDGPIADGAIEDMGFDPLLIDDAWGCCSIINNPDKTRTCRCVEPTPGVGTPPPSATAMIAGRNRGPLVIYDLIAAKGTLISGNWSFSLCGGCRKVVAALDNLDVRGINSTSYGPDYIILEDAIVDYGNASFTFWWGSQDYWDKVTVYGLAGNDSIWGSPQDDEIYGGSGNDTLYGNGGNDTIYGGPGTDYCNCGGSGTAFQCETVVDCD